MRKLHLDELLHNADWPKRRPQEPSTGDDGTEDDPEDEKET